MADPEAAAFAARLRAARTRAGYPSAARLARAVGVSEATAQRWERAERIPSAASLLELAEVLAVDSRWLALGEPSVHAAEIATRTGDTGDQHRKRE